jgi:hypothetical protein
MKIRIAFALFGLLATLMLPAEEFWEGNAAVIRRGVFDDPGLYAASDSFPRNSLILVENIQSGKQVEVTILKRIDGSSNVFLLLSEQAAAEIGLASDEVLPVRARITLTPPGSVIGLPDDLPENPDQDINPSAAVPQLAAPAESLEDLPEAPPIPVAEAPVAAEAASTDLAADSAGEEAQAVAETEEVGEAAEAAEATLSEEAEEPAAGQLSPEEQRLARVSSRLPQKQVYMPPREDERYIAAPLQEEPGPDVALAAASGEAEPAAEPVIEEAEEVEETAEAAADLSLAAAAESEAAEPDLDMPGLDQIEPRETRGLEAQPAPRAEIVSGPAPVPALPAATTAAEEPAVAEPATESEEEPFQLAELFEQPPETPPAAVRTPEQDSVPEPAGDLPLVDALPPASYFLQLAAFSGRGRAEKLVSDLQPTYTVAVLPVMRQNRQLYKVLIGPLNQEESGTLLYRFRSLGYKDAFITRSD